MASRIEELFQDLAESVSGFGESYARGNQQQRQYERDAVDTSDFYKNDPLVLEGLAMAASGPALLGAKTVSMAPRWLAPYIGRSSTYGISPSGSRVGTDMGKQVIKKREPFLPETSRKIKDYAERQKLADQRMMFSQKQIRNNIRNQPPLGSGSRVGTDVAGRVPMPQTKPPLSVVRGPRGNTNIDTPVQRNLDLSDLKPTGIQNTTQARGMNPRMRKDLEKRKSTIGTELYDIDRMSKDGMKIDLDRVRRLRDELAALTKTLLD
tara:strand:- start:973 stop:1767 length:795 start_codon:yes stop_codon:yes gene_type:complete